MFDLSLADQAAADIVEHTERSIERPDEQGKANPGSRAAVDRKSGKCGEQFSSFLAS